MTDAVKLAAGRQPRGTKGTRRVPQTAPDLSLSQSVKTVASHRRNPPSTRAGRKGILLYFDQHVAAAIRELAVDCGATNQDLGEWAFKLLFEKYGETWPA